MVCARVLEAAGNEGDDLLAALVVRYGNESELIGEMALIRGGATTATVVAGRPATVLFLAREYVERLVAGVPEIRQYLDDLAEERELDTQLVLSDDDLFEDDEHVLI